jgi:hypothetical protein
MEPLVTHELDVDTPDGGRRRVLASYWRVPAVGDTWRMEFYDVDADAQGDFFTPRPDLLVEVAPERIGEAEADCRRRAALQRDYAAPHLTLAAAYDAQADTVAELVAQLPELGTPEPEVPERDPAPTPPLDVTAPPAKVRRPSPGPPSIAPEA